MSPLLVPLAGGDNRGLTIALFLAVVAVTLGITFWASRQNKSAADYYAGGRSFTGFQNGLAIGGDYMSAASFLGISGSIALYGYDGFLYSRHANRELDPLATQLRQRFETETGR